MSRAVVDAAAAGADKHGIPRPCFLAVLQFETNGQPCWSDGTPVELPETHRFYERLPRQAEA